MARTVYEKRNAHFSNVAHELARRILYPQLFGTSDLEYEDGTLLQESERGAILDGEMGVDRIVKVGVNKLAEPLTFTIQERFRRPQFARYRDVTITEWNHASGMPSELYKINAGIFLYGYVNHPGTPTGFIEAIAINTTGLLHQVSCNKIPWSLEQNKKRQTFMAYKFHELQKAGLVMFHYTHAANGHVAREAAPF